MGESQIRSGGSRDLPATGEVGGTLVMTPSQGPLSGQGCGDQGLGQPGEARVWKDEWEVAGKEVPHPGIAPSSICLCCRCWLSSCWGDNSRYWWGRCAGPGIWSPLGTGKDLVRCAV